MTVEDRLRDALTARADALAGPDGDCHPADVVVPLSARRSGWLVVGAVAAAGAVVIGAVAMIDRPDPPQRVAADRDSLLGDQALVYVFEKDNQIWGVTLGGKEIRLTSDARAYDPHISPDGRTLVFSSRGEAAAPSDGLTSQDLRTGFEIGVGIGGGPAAFAPNGDLAWAEPTDDSAQLVTVRVGFERRVPFSVDGGTESKRASMSTFGNRSYGTSASLGPSESPGCATRCIGSVQSLAWDTDSRTLLVVGGGAFAGRGPGGNRLWLIDTAPADGTIPPLARSVRGLSITGPGSRWLVGRAIAPGVFPAIARDRGLFGTLIVDSRAETATFIESPQPRRPGEGATDRLDLTTAVSVEALVIGGSPGARTNVPAGYLIADARNLWFLSADGEERLIRSGPTRASATAAAGGFFGASQIRG